MQHRNGGRIVTSDTVRMLPTSKLVDIEALRELRLRGRRPVRSLDETVFVELFTPDVPAAEQ